jgi:hypothetical protein
VLSAAARASRESSPAGVADVKNGKTVRHVTREDRICFIMIMDGLPRLVAGRGMEAKSAALLRRFNVNLYSSYDREGFLIIPPE